MCQVGINKGIAVVVVDDDDDDNINIQRDKKSLCTRLLQYSTIDYLKMAITEYIRNVDRSILNTVFENTVRRVNKCLETGGGHFEHYS